jgi:hypothetical protein
MRGPKIPSAPSAPSAVSTTMITVLGRANRRLDQQVQPRDESHRAAVTAADDADGTDGADAKSRFILQVLTRGYWRDHAHFDTLNVLEKEDAVAENYSFSVILEPQEGGGLLCLFRLFLK